MANSSRMSFATSIPQELYTQKSRDISIPDEQWNPWNPVAVSLESLANVDPRYGLYTRNLTSEGEPYNSYDIALIDRAKRILSQPSTTTPEWIASNFPSLSSLPKETLQAMSQDWQNAYGNMIGVLGPSKYPDKYSRAVVREEEGKPFVSYGGEGEMYSEALPYVTYSPEYGLIVPSQGIRPKVRKRDFLGSFIPAIIGGMTLGPLAGALGGGVLGAAGAGAITGGLTAELTGGDPLKGALLGGTTGGFSAAATPAISGALQSSGITGLPADALTKGAVSAGIAAIRGGDPLQAALSSAAGTTVGGALSGLDAIKSLDPAVASALTSAAVGATKAAMTGSDPVQSALVSAATGTQPGILSHGPQVKPSTDATAQSGGNDLGTLLALLGMSQQQQPEPKPLPTVGEIKPYDFTSDLLAGIYGKPQTNMYSTNDELLKMTRGA